MHSTQKTYSIEDDQRVLILEKQFNSNGKVIKEINYQEKPAIERVFEYNQQGQLVAQMELQHGIENSSQRFEYDDEGEICDEKLFISGELYEHIRLEKNATGSVKTIEQDGELIERIEKDIDGKNWVSRLYSYGELDETVTYTFDPEASRATTEVQVHVDNFRISVHEKLKENGEVIFIERYEDKDLVSSIQFEIENGLVLKRSVKEFGYAPNQYQNLYEYDEQKNLVKFESRASNGSLLAFHTRIYNTDNLLEEEMGSSSGSSGNSGMQTQFSQFHYVYEYV